MQFSFGGLKKAAVKPAAPKQSTSNAGFGCGFGDNDSDSDSADGKKRMGVEMKEQSERNKREAEVIRKECADVFAAFEQDAPDAPDTATTSLETDAPPAPLKFKKTSRFIASMKQSAIQREQDREHTDIRIIRDQAQKTDHLYTEVDAAVAPINTIEYTKKLKEQEEAAMRAADTKEFEKQNAVEKVGMMGFGMSFVESQMKRGDDEKVEDPEEETQRQLEIFLHKKEQKRKKERRAKYVIFFKYQILNCNSEIRAGYSNYPQDFFPQNFVRKAKQFLTKVFTTPLYHTPSLPIQIPRHEGTARSRPACRG